MLDKYLLDATIENGKYIVRCDADGHLYALRNGTIWRDLRGDKLIYCLAAEVQRLRDELVKVTLSNGGEVN